jgi:hypothetical protein
MTTGETRALKTLKTLERIQRFLDTEVAYNKEPDGETIRSPRRALRDRRGSYRQIQLCRPQIPRAGLQYFA